MQTVRQRIPNCWARNGESTSAESAATDARNDELTATGESQMLATRNSNDELMGCCQGGYEKFWPVLRGHYNNVCVMNVAYFCD